MRILVIEDESKTAAFVSKALQTDGYQVDVLEDGAQAVAVPVKTPYDVVILDVMLPGIDGLTLLKSWRNEGVKTPVLLLTARGEISERVAGLDAGADDYLCKPFAIEELLARVRVLSRRTNETNSLILQVADLSINTITREVKRGSTKIDLAPREYRLLEFLARSSGRICARMTLVEKVWDYDFDPGSNLVDVYIMRLREKIDEGFEPKLLHTVRGIGYVLKTPQ